MRQRLKTWKNKCLIAITLAAVAGILIGFGLIDSGLFIKGCAIILICYIWIWCFAYANGAFYGQ